MTQAIERDPIYRGRRFQTETIELCVRWYITYRLSYRDLAAMMAERGIVVAHTTIMRWVLQYVPEYERRWARYATPVNSSWRMDETAVSVRGGLHYLYRAVDKNGKSVGSLLRADRGMDAAQEFFRKALAANEFRWPTTVNLDGNAASHRALRLLADENPKWKSVVVRCCRYLNNVVEQDHRAIKRRCASMLGLKSFKTAAICFSGIELAHRIRKQQFSLEHGGPDKPRSLKQLWDSALASVPVRIRRASISATVVRQCTRTQRCACLAKLCRDMKPLRYRPKGFRRARLVLVSGAKRRSVLALQLPVQRQTQDACLGSPSRYSARDGQEAPSNRAFAARRWHRSF